MNLISLFRLVGTLYSALSVGYCCSVWFLKNGSVQDGSHFFPMLFHPTNGKN